MDEHPDLSGSVTRAIIAIGEHDEEAADLLWTRFFQRLANFAENKVYRRHARFYDGEDVAASAMFAVLDGMKHRRFDLPGSRDDLWHLLVVVASNKASNRRKFFDRQKRGGGNVRGESVFDSQVVAEFVQIDDDPAVMFELEATCQTMLRDLPDNSYRQIALLRMAGHNNEEIAKELDCSARTIERKLVAIRRLWTRLNQGSS